ncbi:MAG TPA: chromate efflux transporter [Tepidiformaceae bacterium]|nr:chromate efflux transporter [Tepidiformaceae bacterium]
MSDTEIAVRSRAGTGSEVFAYFLRLGCIAFGGPAAHVALMRRELVQQKRWLSDEQFVDMLGVANLVPGPNSTEMTMHVGYHRAGWGALWLAGIGFIAPAVAIVLAFAWAYVRYGDTPAGEGILLGVSPVVLAIIVQAIWGLRFAAFHGAATWVVAATVFAAVALGTNEVLALLGGGLVVLAWRNGVRLGSRVLAVAGLPFLAPGLQRLSFDTGGGGRTAELFFVFLKIGAVLYGSGYVLVSFLQADFVDHRGWLTEQQLLDAVAVGQFTPGPLFTTSTFVGYVVDGWQGAAAATVGIFLPSFVLVMLTAPLIPRLRRSPWASAFLDGVNAAALSLMAVTTISLAQGTLDTVFTVALFAVAAAVLLRLSPSSVWLILAGAAAGLAHQVVFRG